jgi:hypothetical protein
MSLYGTESEIFEKRLETVIAEGPSFDGLDLADFLQRITLKFMMRCLIGSDDKDPRDMALFKLIDDARDRLREDYIDKLEEQRKWREEHGPTNQPNTLFPSEELLSVSEL